MQLQITARHLDLTPALAEHVRKKIEKAQRYFDSILRAQAILQVEKHRHLVELIVHVPGSTFRVQGEAGDLYSAVDLATHKLDLQLSRLKDKQRHHRKKGTVPAIQKTRNFLIPKQLELKEEAASLFSEIKQMSLESKSMKDALRELNSNGLPFYLFINERTDQLNLIYRTPKGSYGLLEVYESSRG